MVQWLCGATAIVPVLPRFAGSGNSIIGRPFTRSPCTSMDAAPTSWVPPEHITVSVVADFPPPQPASDNNGNDPDCTTHGNPSQWRFPRQTAGRIGSEPQRNLSRSRWRRKLNRTVVRGTRNTAASRADHLSRASGGGRQGAFCVLARPPAPSPLPQGEGEKFAASSDAALFRPRGTPASGVSMLSRGSTSAGAVGSSNAVCGANRARPSVAEFEALQQQRLVRLHLRHVEPAMRRIVGHAVGLADAVRYTRSDAHQIARRDRRRHRTPPAAHRAADRGSAATG